MSMGQRLNALNAGREVQPNLSYWDLRDVVNEMNGEPNTYDDGKNSSLGTIDDWKHAFAAKRQAEDPSQDSWLDMMYAPNSDYNYDAFYNSDPKRAWDMLNGKSNAHFTDEYKNDNHPTYSDESIESTLGLGPKGGHWYPDENGFQKGATVPTFDAQLNNIDSPELNKFGVNDLYGYFKREEPSYIPTYQGAALLPEAIVKPK